MNARGDFASNLEDLFAYVSYSSKDDNLNLDKINVVRLNAR